MRRAGKILKWFLISILGIILFTVILVGGLAWWTLENPHKAWSLIEKHLMPKDLKISWQDVHFGQEKSSWRERDWRWKVIGLRIQKGAPELLLPIDLLEMNFHVSLFTEKPLLDFREIRVLAQKEQGLLKLKPSEKQSETPPQNFFQQIESAMGYLHLAQKHSRVDHLELGLKRFSIQSGTGEPLLLGVAVRKSDAEQVEDQDKDKDKDKVFLDLSASNKEMKIGLAGHAVVASMGTDKPFFLGRAFFSGFKVDVKTKLIAHFNGDQLKLGLNGFVDYKMTIKKPLHFQPDLELMIDRNFMSLKGHLALSGIPGPIVQLKKIDVDIRVPLEQNVAWSAKPSTFKISSPVDLFFVDKDMRPPIEKSCACKIPETVMVNLDGQIWLKHLLEKVSGKQPVLETKLQIESLKNKLFDMDLAAFVKIFTENQEWIFEPQLDSQARIHSFRGLRNFLDAQNVMIPAPFDKLDGTISLVAKGPVNVVDGKHRLPVNVRLQLQSPNQKVDLESNSFVAFDPRLKGMDVVLNLLIHAFQVELPPLDPIGGLPPIVRDRRLQLKPPQPVKPSRGFAVRLFVAVETKSTGAIRFLSSLAKPHIPVTMNLDRGSTGDLEGFVQVEAFKLEYLRRVLNFENLRIELGQGEKAVFPVRGRMFVNQTDYKIIMEVNGTLRSPAVELSSVPYLPRSEIISVLLYDRTSDQLVSADAETVGGVEAAMADRAIGLFGLWALASTPIRNFSYNALTKVYSATVQLADGLTASVGTNWEEAAYLELRKRISRKWVLTASWSPDEQSEQVGKLVLQWEQRF